MESIRQEFYIRTEDYFLSGQEFNLIKNKEFGFLETYLPPLENLDTYYKSENYISHSDASSSKMEKLYQKIKKINIAYKFSKLGENTKGKSLLDYGCGTGDFIKFAQKKGLIVMGMEPNKNAAQLAKIKVGEELVANTPLKNINQTFDYITLWHVLEHIPNLFEFLEELKSKLNPGGKILIAVPNYLSLDAMYYKKYWAGWDVPRHLWHFSNKSLIKLMNKFELKVVKFYPLLFDSFYVSLLSEKYRKRKLGFVRAVFVGFFSNLFGLFTKNYSSVIYEIEKIENESV